MPWFFFNPDETDEDGPKWQQATEEEEGEFFNLTDNCETVNEGDANNNSDSSDTSDSSDD